MNNIFRSRKQIIEEAQQKEDAVAVSKHFGGKIGDMHLEITLRTDIPDQMETMLKLLEDCVEDIKQELLRTKPFTSKFEE